MRTLEAVINKLPRERREKIKARTEELVAEEMSLQAIRKSLGLTQEEVAQKLSVGQDSVSRIEKGRNLYVSTVQSMVESMGGELDLVVRLPGRGPVVLTGLDVRATAKKARAVLTVRDIKGRVAAKKKIGPMAAIRSREDAIIPKKQRSGEVKALAAGARAKKGVKGRSQAQR